MYYQQFYVTLIDLWPLHGVKLRESVLINCLCKLGYFFKFYGHIKGFGWVQGAVKSGIFNMFLYQNSHAY
jgi:hypothetical protein